MIYVIQKLNMKRKYLQITYKILRLSYKVKNKKTNKAL